MDAKLRVAILGLLAGTLQSCTWVGDKAAEAIYPDLEEPANREAPPTFKAFPSSEITQAIIGGRGDGMSCSIPAVGTWFFRVPEKLRTTTADVSLHFRPSCAMHDLCYRHGMATYGYTQADCDRALQESAFRMCRQIRKEGLGKVYKDCQTQAKKVLLGVSLGGAGSFQPAGKSTFFEYDPMPEEADDYVVARGYPVTEQQANAGELGVVTYHFLRNSVKARALTVDPKHPEQLLKNGSPAVAFPDQFIATAPGAERLEGDKPKMIAMARKGYGNTSVELVQYKIDTSQGDTALELARCPSPMNADCPVEPDGSVTRLARVNGRPTLLTLLHGGRIGLKHLDAGGDPTYYPLNGAAHVNDGYRFLHNELLLERDASGNDSHAWVLARGLKLDEANRAIVPNADGRGYDKQVLVLRRTLENNNADGVQPFIIDLPETGDPLMLVRLQPGEGSALLSLGWTQADLAHRENGEVNEASPQLSVWQLREGTNALLKHAPEPLPAALRERFIERPPIVVDAPGIPAPVFVWTRVSDDTQGAEKGAVALDIHLSALNTGATPMMRDLGAFRCDINLGRQRKTPAANDVAILAKRKKSVTSRAEHTDETTQLFTEELIQRWQMSQTLVTRRPAGDGGTDDLGVTTVFKGYPGMSFQVVLANDNGRYRYKRTLPTSDWVNCEPAKDS